jgi:hypothetical protein
MRRQYPSSLTTNTIDIPTADDSYPGSLKQEAKLLNSNRAFPELDILPTVRIQKETLSASWKKTTLQSKSLISSKKGTETDS